VLKVFVQHVRYHTQDVGELAGCCFVFEVAHDDGAEIPAHDVDCRAPIRRKRPGWSSLSIMRPAKVTPISSASDCFGQFGSGNASVSRALSAL